MNHKRFFPLLLFCITVVPVNFALSQGLTTDSLRVVISNAPNDTTKVMLMVSLANEFFWSGKYDSAHETALKAKSTADKLMFKKGAGLALVISGQSHLRMGNYDEAERLFKGAVSIFQDVSFPKEKASAHLYLGQVYDYKANYAQALREYDIAKELATSADDKIGMTKILNSIGITQFNRGNYEEALQNYLAAFKTTDLTGNEKIQATILNNIGVVNIELLQYEDALRYFLKYVEAMKKLKGTHGLGVGYKNVGEAYTKLRHFEKAIPYLDSASQIQSQTGDKKGLSLSYSNLGDVYKELGDVKQSRAHYLNSIELARQIKNEEVLLKPLNGLSDLYVRTSAFAEGQATVSEARTLAQRIGSKSSLERSYLISSRLDSARGDFRSAYSWFKKYAALSDSLFDEAKSRQVFQMRELYESERKDQAIRLLSESKKLAEVEEASTKKIFTIYLLSLSLIILIVSYWLFQKTRDSRVLKRQKEELLRTHDELTKLIDKVETQNHVLEQKNEILNELHREKDGLIGIVAHDLRSPLNRIRGLVQLVNLSGDVNTEQQFLLDNVNRVCDDGNRLIADLLELNEYETREKISLEPVAIGPLVETQTAHFQTQARAKNIDLRFLSTVDEDTTVCCIPDYLKRILDNLISNALKFSPSGKCVWVSIDQSLNHDRIILRVKDEGPGFTEQDRNQLFKKFRKLSARPTGGESSTGLGLSIVKALTDKIRGTINVVTKEGEGATFIIELAAAGVEVYH